MITYEPERGPNVIKVDAMGQLQRSIRWWRFDVKSRAMLEILWVPNGVDLYLPHVARC